MKLVKQSGNALFLILIAVALFAALSYAVTQSGRGGGNIDRETAVIKASQMMQQAELIKQTVTKMRMFGTTFDNLDLTSHPANYHTTACSTGVDCVFASEGGGLTSEQTADGTSWTYIEAGATYFGLIDGFGPNTDQVRIVTRGVSEAVCTAFNAGLGLSAPVTDDGTAPWDAYSNEPSACFQNTLLGGDYVIYHLLGTR